LGLDREGGIEDFSMVQESEWDEIVELYQLYNLSGADKSRRPKYFYSRKDWDAHSEEQIYTGSWQASYHMSVKAIPVPLAQSLGRLSLIWKARHDNRYNVYYR
jgi:hypothetical protein